MKTKYKYIHFTLDLVSLVGEKCWVCRNNRTKNILGIIGDWNEKKEFQPEPNTGFTEDCLRDIAHFISQL